MQDELIARIENDFTYHKPTPDMVPQFKEIRDAGKALALTMAKHCPRGRELSSALTKIEEGVMHANAAIARTGEPTPNA